MTTKDYVLSVEAKISHLFVYVRGTRDRKSVAGVSIEVYNAALANQLSKVLVDVRAFEGRLDVVDAFFVVTELFPNLRGKGLKKAAIVDRSQSAMREWFLETVVVNRGFNLRIFTEIEEALRGFLITYE